MYVRDVMRPMAKPINSTESAQGAAERMRREDAGCLMVGDWRHLEGMITDRDLSLRCVAEGRKPSSTPVRDIMSVGVVYCREDETVGEVVERMMDLGLMRLPVINHKGQAVGMISARDSVRSVPMAKIARNKPAVAHFFKEIPSSFGRMHRVPVHTVYVTGVEGSEDAKKQAIERLQADRGVADWLVLADGLEIEWAA